uniref:Reverse transcriptase domain-containing protein n=1 Tax=Sparus aurata TaxID=8175 RepID=A0A671TR16_SPAAU
MIICICVIGYRYRYRLLGAGSYRLSVSALKKGYRASLIISEFYIEFKDELVPVLDRLFRGIEERNEIPADMSTGLVSILYKKGNRDKLENYRPITMLNTDYKILARVLAKRIKRVIGTVVENTQAYSIPGRDIADITSSIRDTIHHMKERKGGIVMSLDLNKAFDRVDHNYLHRVLERMGFGNRLGGWIKRLYNGAVSCVKINGIVTDTFRLERSVRQGCPLSSLLYSISAEPLAQVLKLNNKISGIEIPGGQVSLLYQYADDTTVTVKDRESVLEVVESVELYGRASGARVNIEKSEIMYIGEDSGGRVEIGLKEKKDYLRVLGVNLGIKDKEGRDMQLEGIVNSIKKTLSFWKHRGLGLKGKVVVVNALVMSKFAYVMNVMDVPERVLKDVDKLVSEFLWEGKGVRIAREVMENEYEDGGLKLINLEKKKKALRVKMMTRYLRNRGDHTWKVFLKEAIDKCGGCGESGVFMKLKKGMLEGVSDFYKEMLGSWGEFVECVQYECKSANQVWEQPVFLNPKIRWEGETVYNRLMWRAGFRKVRDLVYEYVPGFMRAQVIVDEVRDKGDEIWLGTAEGVMEKIKEGMPKEWMGMIERENEADEEGDIEMYVGEGERSMKLTSVKTRVLYKCLGKKDVRRPAAEKVWERVMNEMDVRGIWKNLRVKWNSSECENFDFLLRHNRIFNNLIISKFDMNVDKKCDVCGVEVETCMHEFLECRELKTYFERLKDLISRCWEGSFVERMEWKELWLFGVTRRMKGCNVSLLNYMFSHARFAVKLRRNMVHYEKRKADVWSMFRSGMKRDVHMTHRYIKKEIFLKDFIEGSSLIEIGDNGEVKMNFD